MPILNKLNWYFYRLRSMGLAELVYRIQQIFTVYQEAWFGYAKQKELSDLEGVWEAFLSESSTEFFFSNTTKKHIAKLYDDAFPHGKEKTLSIANKLLENQVVLFQRTFQLSEDFMWHEDPLSKKKWPNEQFWGDIDIRNGRSIGGVKWVWELNRHHHIVTLAKAYFITNQQAFAQKACDLLNNWIDDNPPGRGVNWTSSLELSLRIINWSWVLAFLKDSDALNPQLFKKINQSVMAQATHISRHLSQFSSANNHLVGEAAGLAFAGICFPWLAKASEWRNLGLKIMAREVPLQILEDGVPAEQATQYFAFMLDFNLHVWRLAELNRLPVPESWLERTTNAVTYFQAMLTDKGQWPPIGDSDNAWVVRLDEFGEKTRLFSFKASFELLHQNRPPFLDEKSFWLFGEAALDVQPSQDRQQNTSKNFPTGGYAVMRAKNVLATADFGPLGYLATAAHGHADALSLTLMVNERPFLIDPNTYAFQEGYEWRDYFRSTPAHNTIAIDGLNQSEMLGTFLWGRRANGRLLHWDSNEQMDIFVAEHNGYKGIGVVHQRAIYFEKPDKFVIIDYLSGSKKHKIEQFWHLADETKLKQEGQSFLITLGSETAVINFDSSNNHNISVIVGQENPIQGWNSPHYGIKVPAPVIVCTLESNLPMTLRTQILLQSSDRSAVVKIPAEIFQTVNRYLG